MNFRTCSEALAAGYAVRTYCIDDANESFYLGHGRPDATVRAGSVALKPITINGARLSCASVADLA